MAHHKQNEDVKLNAGTVSVDGSSNTAIGDGGNTNYTKFDATGHQTMLGSAQPWDDLRIEPTLRSTGPNIPTFEQWFDDNGIGDTGSTRGIYLYSFDDSATEKEVFFTMQLPHDWNCDDIYLHVHWIGAVADTTSAPRWGLEFNWKEIGATFGAAGIIYTDGKNYIDGTTDDANVVAGKHYISKFTVQSPDTTQDGMSSILIGRLFRNSGDVLDTYNASGAKCGLLYIDAHYQRNSIGSNDEYVK